MKLPQCKKLSAAQNEEYQQHRKDPMPLRLLQMDLEKWRDLS
jgi:hypothetical protein